MKVRLWFEDDQTLSDTVLCLTSVEVSSGAREHLQLSYQGRRINIPGMIDEGSMVLTLQGPPDMRLYQRLITPEQAEKLANPEDVGNRKFEVGQKVVALNKEGSRFVISTIREFVTTTIGSPMYRLEDDSVVSEDYLLNEPE